MKGCVKITWQAYKKDKPRVDSMNNMLESNAINYELKGA